jgi:hypothetical protein
VRGTAWRTAPGNPARVDCGARSALRGQLNALGEIMLGKLKDLASAGVSEKVVGTVEPIIREHVAKAQALGIASVRDDATYLAHIVQPAYLSVLAAASGATKLIPQFEERFKKVMHALRDELLIFEEDKVRLVEDYQTRLQALLLNALKTQG